MDTQPEKRFVLMAAIGALNELAQEYRKKSFAKYVNGWLETQVYQPGDIASYNNDTIFFVGED